MSTRQRPGFPARLDRPADATARARATPAPVARSAPAPVRDAAALRVPQAPSIPQGLGLDSQTVRMAMVHKLAAQGIRDARVLDAMGRVERHRFVDTALAPQAYEDTSLPIGLGQTISKPNVVARMIELLLACPGLAAGERMGRVLEIGTGCGYQAAVLSLVAKEVYSIERLRGLHEKARANLRHFRLPNVHLLFGDGMVGYPRGAPYAGIIAAAGGEAVPSAWIDQLAVGGRLVAPVARASGGAQALLVLDKTPTGVQHSLLEAVHFVPLKSGIG
ncbi:MAG: protein-L-isoaspartate(D-aspartate) O-methyltransferase [Hylemonella sp.]|uniref:protein-L-isoaspartate(D-aspartate) O-methyltransferase n=1 Tax=Hylemonella sp. TaxID=2066020 RepID=UPI00391A6387